MMMINHLVSKTKKTQFVIIILIGEACISKKGPFYSLNSSFKDILREVGSEKLTEHMITSRDQHFPGIQLLSANVIKCSLFAFKLSSQTEDRLVFIYFFKCLTHLRIDAYSHIGSPG